MSTNPERLWITCAPDGYAVEARGYSNEADARAYRESLRDYENADAFSDVAEYVLASVADKALDEKHAQLVSVADRLRGKVSAAENEAAALRRERDALAAKEQAYEARISLLVSGLGWLAGMGHGRHVDSPEARTIEKTLQDHYDLATGKKTEAEVKASWEGFDPHNREDEAAAKGVG